MRSNMWTKPDENRRSFIGGSDARIIMGSDEEALLRLWREKRGEVEPEDLSAICRARSRIAGMAFWPAMRRARLRRQAQAQPRRERECSVRDEMRSALLATCLPPSSGRC